MSEYKDEYNNKKEDEEKSDDKSRDNVKDISDESKQEYNFVEKDEKDALSDDLFEPKRDLTSDVDDFVPDEKCKLISMDFKPDINYKPDMGSFEPQSDISPDLEDFKPDKNYKPDMESFEPQSDISPDLEDFKPDENYKPDKESFEPIYDISPDIEDFKPDKNRDSDDNVRELNSENELNKDQEKNDDFLEPDREYEQNDNYFDEKSRLIDNYLESNNDCESDFPIQSNEDQIRAEIEEKKEGLENKDDDNPFEKSNEELKTKDKEKFIESEVVNHEISFKYLLEHDLKDIIEDIKRAEDERLIYGQDAVAYAKDLYLNGKSSTEIDQKREELNDTLEGDKRKNGNGVIIENFEDFRLSSGEDMDQEREKNTESSQIKEFDRNIKGEFLNSARETNKDERVISEKERGFSTGRDSKQFIVQVLKSETQPLNQAEKHQDLNEKSFQNEVNKKPEQEKQEKKEEKAIDQAIIDRQIINSQDIRSRDKENKADKIEKQEKKNEITPTTDKFASQESSESKELNDLKEKYRQESGKRPIYRGVETKGFVEWKRQKTRLIKPSTVDSTNSHYISEFKTGKNSGTQRIQSEKSLKKQESKEEWESTLRKWVNEANEKEVSSEIKKELTEIIEHYGELRGNYMELDQLIRKYKNRNIVNNEVKQLTSLIEKFKKLNPDHKELFINLRAFRNFYLGNEIWYKERTFAEKEKFTTFLAQKLQLLKNNRVIVTKGEKRRLNIDSTKESQFLSNDIPGENTGKTTQRRALLEGRDIKYVILNSEQVSTLVHRLKTEKGYSQHSLSKSIGSSIGSVINRGSALPYECFQKLENIAKEISFELNIKKIIEIKKYTLNDMHILAQNTGLMKTGMKGNFLSKEYKGLNKKHIWQCGKCGRIWESLPASILYQNSWCIKCSKRERRTYAEVLELAKERGIENTGVEGKLLTSEAEYKKQKYPDRTRFQWQCGKCGHIWEATLNNIARVSWCRNCQYELLSRELRTPYEEIVTLARETGRVKTGIAGEFLATEEDYIKIKHPSNYKFQWKCGKCGNKFEMDITHVKRPQWCPICTEGESEGICRGYFERIFKAPFPRISPKWLINPITGGLMHFDGYNEKLKMAFEFNGPQHYIFYPKYHKSYKDFLFQLEKDATKVKLCAKQDIFLIIVPYTLDYDDFQGYIIKEYTRLTGKKLENLRNYNWRMFKRQKEDLSKFL